MQKLVTLQGQGSDTMGKSTEYKEAILNGIDIKKACARSLPSFSS